jgi:aminopeptidase N
MRPALLPAALVASLALFAAPAHAAPPSPGSAGLGDRLFPQLGNGGYDALHYDLDLRYATASPTQAIDGTATMLARSTQALSRFDLDFAGRSVGSISVDGQPASFTRVGQDVVVTPTQAIPNDKTFQVTVSHFAAVPTVPDTQDYSLSAFFSHPDGTATAGQPNFSHYFLPSNDHPRDLATFEIHFAVPAGATAVANGVLQSQDTSGGRSHFTYVQRQPMATELIQLAVGDLDVVEHGVHSGVFLRDVFGASVPDAIRGDFDLTGSQIDWMQDRVGRYPFDLYGSLVVRPTSASRWRRRRSS